MPASARHPLQRLASPSLSASAALHAAGLLSFAASFRFLFTFHGNHDIEDGFGSHWQHLTIIGLTGSALAFLVGFLADLTGSVQLFTIKNILSVCFAPLEVLISILYWSISAIDKALLFPPELQLDMLPDIGFHAMPAVLLTLDLLLLSPPYAIKAYNAWGLSMVIAFMYWYWVELCFSKNGAYPYPIFALLNTWQRIMLFSTSAVLMTGSTVALKWLYGKINGIEEMKKDALNPIKDD